MSKTKTGPETKPQEETGGDCPSASCSASFEYQPESWAMLKDTIYHARRAIEVGIEYAQEVLIERDNSLGRTTRSNRTAAEMMEREIEQMNECLEKLKQPDGQFHLPNIKEQLIR